MRGGKQIVAARDQGHALVGVIDGDGQMVSRRHVLAGKDDVAEEPRIDGNLAMLARRAGSTFVKSQGAHQAGGFGAVESQCVWRSRCDTVGPLMRAEMTAGSRIERAVRTVWRFNRAGDLFGNLPARTETGIEQTCRVELLQRAAIGRCPVGLAQHRLFPVKIKPMQILENRLDKFLSAPRRVEILDAQQEPAACGMRGQRSERMAQMQKAGWTWRKSRDNHSARLHDRAGMIIRPAKPEDGPAVAAVRVASWRATYRGIVPDSYLETMNSNEAHWCKVASGEEPGVGLCVCEADNLVVGFACYGAARAPQFDFSGELYAVYFLPAMIGKGHGAAAMLEAASGLKSLGYSDMILWVIENNERARLFYESFGGTVIANSRQSFEIDGTTIWEVAYGFRPLPEPRANR
jgi:ribosomal protein S18 acetylase RimI-like enzyme